jgi:hypothetical protein
MVKWQKLVSERIVKIQIEARVHVRIEFQVRVE